MVAQAYNPAYLGDRDQEEWGWLKASPAKKLRS
jgi:hypothetical protein